MLRLPPFEYLSPPSLAEAIDILATYKTDAMIVAGGTDLYPGMKRRIFTPKKLVSLRRLPELQSVTPQENGVTLGAGVTLTQLATQPLLQQRYSALVTAAAAVSTPQLRNMGTLGGNLCVDTRCTYYNQSESWRQALGYCLKKEGTICWVAPSSARCLAVQSSDTAPALIALGANVCLVGPQGTRWVPVEALYQNDGVAYVTKQPDEIVTKVQVPPADGVRSAYHKLRRRGAFDFPVLSVAVALRQREDGLCSDVRIVLGAVASAPLRANAAEAILLGSKLTDALLSEAAHTASKLAHPLDNTDMTLSYRKHMTQIYVARALREVVQLNRSNSNQ